jgi:Fic family protein
MSITINQLPLKDDVESINVLRALASAHRALAELKGIASTIPNETILINTLGLQEAKDSSAIENIITTHDDLYKAGLNLDGGKSLQAKEVQNYISALKRGFALVKERGIISNKIILEIQEELENNNAGFRKVPGTVLRNTSTDEVVFTPPQDHQEILGLMGNLEEFINDDQISHLDPLVKMAIIHHQFESIHPFYDGNGRTGRILNVLYLVTKGLLNIPILYLSKYIISDKSSYYNLLTKVRESGEWEDWLLYMIKGVEKTSLETIETIKKIQSLMMEYKHELRDNYKFYSQDLLNNLFQHPYTKIELLEKDLGVTRLTASNYLNKLVEDELLVKLKLGRSNYYVNHRLYRILVTV